MISAPETKPEFTFRLIEANDVDSAAILYLRAFQLCSPGSTDHQIKSDSGFAQAKSIFEARLGSRKEGALVVAKGNAVIGFSLFRVVELVDHCWLHLQFGATDGSSRKMGASSQRIAWL